MVLQNYQHWKQAVNAVGGASRIGSICLAFLHHVFSNASSNCLQNYQRAVSTVRGARMMLASQLRNKPPIRVCMSDEGKGGKALGTGVKSGRQNVAIGVDKNTKGWNEVKDHN